MSIESHALIEQPTGFPELTELGVRIEVLRIQRGLSKQQLARGAGTSRQQLWRVATGKSELTTSLRQRIADVLQVDPSALRQPNLATAVLPAPPPPPPVMRRTVREEQRTVDLAAFVGDPERITRTLATLPVGAEGRRLKRALLDALEDLALEHRLPLTAEFFELRRRVLAGEL